MFGVDCAEWSGLASGMLQWCWVRVVGRCETSGDACGRPAGRRRRRRRLHILKPSNIIPLCSIPSLTPATKRFSCKFTFKRFGLRCTSNWHGSRSFNFFAFCSLPCRLAVARSRHGRLSATRRSAASDLHIHRLVLRNRNRGGAALSRSCNLGLWRAPICVAMDDWFVWSHGRPAVRDTRVAAGAASLPLWRPRGIGADWRLHQFASPRRVHALAGLCTRRVAFHYVYAGGSRCSPARRVTFFWAFT